MAMLREMDQIPHSVLKESSGWDKMKKIARSVNVQWREEQQKRRKEVLERGVCGGICFGEEDEDEEHEGRLLICGERKFTPGRIVHNGAIQVREKREKERVK